MPSPAKKFVWNGFGVTPAVKGPGKLACMCQVSSWDICVLVLSATPHPLHFSWGGRWLKATSYGLVQKLGAGLSAGLTPSSGVCFLESGCACTLLITSFGATAGSLAVASAFLKELVIRAGCWNRLT